MKAMTIFLLLASCTSALANGQDRDETLTTVYIVRHADRDGKKDALTQAGRQRAEQLKQIMAPLNVDVIYSTDYTRTKETVGPTAKTLGLPVKMYGRTSPEWFDALRKNHRGKVVLIAGHSNTVVPLVNGLGAKLKYEIGEDEFENLFVVQIKKGKTTVVQLKYGNKRAEIR